MLFLVHFLVFCQDGWVYCDATVLLTSHLAFFAPVALSGHFSLQAHVRLALSCQAYPFWPRQNTPASAGVHDPRNPNPALPINKARVAFTCSFILQPHSLLEGKVKRLSVPWGPSASRPEPQNAETVGESQLHSTRPVEPLEVSHPDRI